MRREKISRFLLEPVLAFSTTHGSDKTAAVPTLPLMPSGTAINQSWRVSPFSYRNKNIGDRAGSHDRLKEDNIRKMEPVIPETELCDLFHQFQYRQARIIS